MNKFIDAIGLALSSIWANKLRSFMMVLGNIVAVTSIIAVVSLIQGMNGYVAQTIVEEVGVGTFKVVRVGVITDEEEENEARRRNPFITTADARAVRDFSPLFDAVMAESSWQANVSFRDTVVENVSIRGVSPEYDQFSGYSAERGRTISRIEVERSRPLAYLGFETAEKLFKGRNPVDQTILVNGVHHRVVGVNEKKGTMFGNSLDDFVVIPLGSFLKLFGSRRSLELPVTRPRGDGRGPCGAQDCPQAQAGGPRQLRHRHVGHVHGALVELLAGCLRGAHRHRLAVARGGWHRHHEHHADGGERADA
jgi:putative ABC transport system permease protein